VNILNILIEVFDQIILESGEIFLIVKSLGLSRDEILTCIVHVSDEIFILIV
jgi:hypothetical protein